MHRVATSIRGAAELLSEGVDAERSGTGLGLAIVKSVVEALGGTLIVVSQLVQGMQIRVRLPVRLRERA